MFRRKHRSVGQALVEFTLAATLIFFLLAAAVDLGLVFFTLQGVRVAAQEGATYGSYPVKKNNPAGDGGFEVTLNSAEIISRIRNAGGTNGGGFADLLDLNNDGVADDPAALLAAANDPNGDIYIENLRYTSATPPAVNGACRTTVANVDMRNAARTCAIRVTVRYNYRFIFPLAPAFGNTIRLRSTFEIRMRSSFVG